MKKIIWGLAIAFFAASCGSEQTGNKNTAEKKAIVAPEFSADSAYTYVETQVNFGPRVPNTEAHKQCADFLSTKLKSFGAEVTVQEAELKAFDGTMLQAKNIIGSFNPELGSRVLLMAHWDSRPFADQEKDPEAKKTPILGANDGASGVGVILEIARQLSIKKANIGVDVIFFDAEDYGQSSDTESWCLGSQYWAKNPHKKNYNAQYGILFDMVGAPGALFTREAVSMHYASETMNKVWNAGNELGYSDFFSYEKTGQIIDDHMFVNQIAEIPSIDIIQHDRTTPSYFGSYWHTHGDNMDVIDKQTLKAVGQTVLYVIYQE